MEVAKKVVAEQDHSNAAMKVVKNFRFNGQIFFDAIASSQQQNSQNIHVPSELCELVKATQHFRKVRVAVKIGMNAHGEEIRFF